MPTPYVKQTWIDGVAGATPISAARLTYIEDGIENATVEDGTYAEKPRVVADIRDWGADGLVGVDIDNALAINGLFAQGVDVVRMPKQSAGDYKFATTGVILPEKTLVLSGASRIKPLAQVDMIDLRQSGKLYGGIIDVLDGVAGATFEKAALALYGTTNFGTPHVHTVVRDVWLRDKVVGALGVGLLLDSGTATDNRISFVNIDGLQIDGFREPVRVHARTPASSRTWINNNKLTGLFCSRGRRFMTLQADSDGQISGNIIDAMYQANSVSETGLLCIGGVNGNEITVDLVDWSFNKGEYSAAIDLDEKTSYNTVKTFMPSTSVSDKGTNNEVRARAPETSATMRAGSSHNVSNLSLLPNTNNLRGRYGDSDEWLSSADSRFTVTFTGPSSVTGDSTAKTRMFDGDADSRGDWTPVPVVGTPLVIEIDLLASNGPFSALGISFWGRNIPKNVKCEIFYSGAWATVLDLTDNRSPSPVAYPHRATSGADTSPTSKIRWTLSETSVVNTGTTMSIESVWAFHAFKRGQVWTPRSLYAANSILKADTIAAPAAMSVPASTIVGRKATGSIAAMTVTEAQALLLQMTPKQVAVACLALPASGSVGTWAPVQNSAAFFGGYLRNLGAQNDRAEWDVGIPGGTWALDFYYFKDVDSGIYTFNINTVSLTVLGGSTTTVDGYAAAPVAAHTRITGITLGAGNALQRIKLLMSTKNASSSAYYGYPSAIVFSQTA